MAPCYLSMVTRWVEMAASDPKQANHARLTAARKRPLTDMCISKRLFSMGAFCMRTLPLPIIASIAFRVCIAKWGAAAFWVWCLTCASSGMIIAVWWGSVKYRLKRQTRKACRDQIFYAQKQRVAFGRPAFGYYEIIEMRRLAHAGDFDGLGRFLVGSEAALRKRDGDDGSRLPGTVSRNTTVEIHQ